MKKRFEQKRYLRSLEKAEQRRRARAEVESALAESGKRVLVGAVLTGAALLVGFHLGTNAPHAAVPSGITPYMVEPFPDTFPEDGTPPVAINEMITAKSEWESLGTWKITHYCPCRKCSGKWGRQTSSGETCEEGITAACAILPAGTVVKIDGYGERVVQDTGAGVRGNHLDVFYESHSECLERGIKYREVWVKRK